MPAIDKELRERIDHWKAGWANWDDAMFPRGETHGLCAALISALEAAAPAVALAAQIEEYNIVEFCDETNYGNTATCPECRGWSQNGHHDGCEWGAAFRDYRTAQDKGAKHASD